MMNKVKIENCTLLDLQAILNLYEAARQLQTTKQMVVWPYFSEDFVIAEINEKRQWKIADNGEMLCNWALTYSDYEIWGEKDKGDSIFIHRICNNPNSRGQRFIDLIVEWAKDYAKSQNKKYVRLDTLGDNKKLISHYTSTGFQFLGIFRLTDTKNLPKHYQEHPNCCLFELEVN